MTKITKNLNEAVDVLKKGGSIIYPTETSYGIGVDATNEKSIKKVYEIKKRKKPISIIVADLKMAKNYVSLNKATENLMRKFMPGPLTLVVEKKNLPDLLSKEKIAFRISSNKIARELTKKLGKPITATSANISGSESIFAIEKIKKVFYGKVDLILDAGDLEKRKSSTIYDVEQKKILRKGDITFSQLLEEKMQF